jgi:hypothetical protein
MLIGMKACLYGGRESLIVKCCNSIGCRNSLWYTPQYPPFLDIRSCPAAHSAFIEMVQPPSERLIRLEDTLESVLDETDMVTAHVFHPAVTSDHHRLGASCIPSFISTPEVGAEDYQ